MRRVLLGLALPLITVAGASADSQRRASLEQFACHSASVALNRAVSITAVMRARTGLPRLELEFELKRKRPRAGRWEPVKQGDLGQWISPSDPTLGQRQDDVWRFDKQVVNLAAPAVYRFKVRFRWSGSERQSEVTLFSRRCVQSRG